MPRFYANRGGVEKAYRRKPGQPHNAALKSELGWGTCNLLRARPDDRWFCSSDWFSFERFIQLAKSCGLIEFGAFAPPVLRGERGKEEVDGQSVRNCR